MERSSREQRNTPTSQPGGRRALCTLGLAPLLAALPAMAVQPVVRKSAAAPWRLVINEAVTGESNIFLLTSRYQPMADLMVSDFKGQTIGIEPVVDIKRFMILAQGPTKPDLIFGKSVNQLAKLVRDDKYQPVVRRADPYKAAFIVDKNAPYKTLADLGKARVLMPDEYAATTAVAKAELRRHNLTEVEISHTKFQEAVAQQVQAGLVHVGVVNPSTARKWVEQGGRLLAETQPVVNWSVLASPHFSAETVAHLRDVLLRMNTQAPSIMKAIGVKEWAVADRKDYMALLEYTKE
ncbi:MAG: PhnD/SsuA/transferrin family substrate-binding protein [Ramlibacter sp.]|nr:PhnD/SsuA/transferrin family substrate-binding protein [Ramlibacter sp.]